MLKSCAKSGKPFRSGLLPSTRGLFSTNFSTDLLKMFALFPTQEGGHAANPFPKEKGPSEKFQVQARSDSVRLFQKTYVRLWPQGCCPGTQGRWTDDTGPRENSGQGLIIAVYHFRDTVRLSPWTSNSFQSRSEEHTSELQSQFHLVCRLLLEKKKK